MDHVHLMLIYPGPVIMVRVPWPMPRWRSILKAITPVVREHGYMKKEVTSIEMLTSEPDDPEFERYRDEYARAEAAFAGSRNFAKVWLYDWRNGRFKLVREPLEP